MKIKVCGMKYPPNINEIGALHPDFMGFIFYSGSSRFVGDNFSMDAFNSLPESTKKVAVFVNESIDTITKIQKKFGFDYIQLHGDESPEFCEALKAKNNNIIKAFSLDRSFDFSILENYKNHCDCFLFDTKGKNYGGTGKSFDWSVLQNYKLDLPYLLSGGIGLDNINEALEMKHNMLFGFDLNSKIENEEPALKSIEITRNIFKTIRNYEYVQHR